MSPGLQRLVSFILAESNPNLPLTASHKVLDGQCMTACDSAIDPALQKVKASARKRHEQNGDTKTIDLCKSDLTGHNGGSLLNNELGVLITDQEHLKALDSLAQHGHETSNHRQARGQ